VKVKLIRRKEIFTRILSPTTSFKWTLKSQAKILELRGVIQILSDKVSKSIIIEFK